MTTSTVDARIFGAESGVLTCRQPDGVLVASAYHGRDGWQVTRRTTGWHQWFLESEADARLVLNVIGGQP